MFVPLQDQSNLDFKHFARKREKDEQNHAKLDMIFLAIFPVIFIAFNAIYWCTLIYGVKADVF